MHVCLYACMQLVPLDSIRDTTVDLRSFASALLDAIFHDEISQKLAMKDGVYKVRPAISTRCAVSYCHCHSLRCIVLSLSHTALYRTAGLKPGSIA